jgi:hypothetical protein
MHNLSRSLCAAILAAIVVAPYCLGQQKSEKSNLPGEKTKPMTEIIEDFAPMTLGDYDVDIEPGYTQKSAAADLDQLLKGGGESDSSSQSQMVTGYRVQLVSTRDGDEARAVKRDAFLSFEENVYVTFDDPYYKVRLGDFQSRYDAEILQEKAMEKGFVEAWVVRTQVFIQPQKETDALEESAEKAASQKP